MINKNGRKNRNRKNESCIIINIVLCVVDKIYRNCLRIKRISDQNIRFTATRKNIVNIIGN